MITYRILENEGRGSTSREFVIEEKENGCWESISHKAKDGWGYTTFRKTKAHRRFYAKFKGIIPNGLHVLHKCDNPACCNPNHLFLGTNLDNMRDKVSKGRQPSHVGKSNPKCKLKEQDIINILKDTRPQITISKEYGVSDCTIRDIKKFRTWTHITNELRGVV